MMLKKTITKKLKVIFPEITIWVIYNRKFLRKMKCVGLALVESVFIKMCIGTMQEEN